METLGSVAIAIVIFYGGSRVVEGATTPGTFFSFTAALVMLYGPARQLARAVNTTAAVGSWWLQTGVTGYSVIGGKSVAWAQNIIWGTSVIGGNDDDTYQIDEP